MVLRLPGLDPKQGRGSTGDVNRPHWVNDDLDEGPFIEHAAERVHHPLTAAQLTTLGNEFDTIVLR
jgi:formyltetrahydrofolate hydrolase